MAKHFLSKLESHLHFNLKCFQLLTVSCLQTLIELSEINTKH